MRKYGKNSIAAPIIFGGLIVFCALLLFCVYSNFKSQQSSNNNRMCLFDATTYVSDADREQAFLLSRQERLQDIFCQYDGVSSSKVELDANGFATVTLTVEASLEEEDEARLIDYIQNCISCDPEHISIIIE